MANKPGEANFFPDVPEFPSMGTFQPVYGKFDLTTYIQGASDYEIMAFLVGKYNACLEAYGTVTKLSTDTITAAHQLQDWINNWFDNLDVQEELNKKIDNMVANGTFANVLKPLVQGFSSPVFVDSTDKMTDHAKIYVLSTNGHIYQWNGSQFVDTNSLYAQAQNAVLGYNGFPHSNPPTAPYNNLNTLPNNVFVWYERASDVTNAPENLEYEISVFTYNATPEQGPGATQLLVDDKGRLYTRLAWANGSGGTVWTDWQGGYNVIQGNNRVFTGTKTPPAPYNDLNTLPNNTFTWYQYASTVSNAPENLEDEITVFTYNATPEQGPGATQLLVDDKGRLYTRLAWANGSGGTVWTDWQGGYNVIQGNNRVFTGTKTPPAPYNDLNTLPNNTFTWYQYASTVSNAPENLEDQITVFTYNATPQQSAGATQLLVDDKGRLYTRLAWSYTGVETVWTDWQSGYNVIQGNPYSSKVYKPFNFNAKALFVGDSITYGFTSGTTTTTNNWPKLLNDRVRFTSYTNDALGGACITPNVNSIKSIYQQVQDATDKNVKFLFIAGGVNDWQLNVELDTFRTAMTNLCNYINTNYPTDCNVIFITPINEAGWPNKGKYNLNEYRKIITEIANSLDTNARFSIIQGNEFEFPNENGNANYIASVFGDKLHPSELGYKAVYVPGVLSKII